MALSISCLSLQSPPLPTYHHDYCAGSWSTVLTRCVHQFSSTSTIFTTSPSQQPFSSQPHFQIHNKKQFYPNKKSHYSSSYISANQHQQQQQQQQSTKMSMFPFTGQTIRCKGYKTLLSSDLLFWGYFLFYF
ncbi:hypothetical protein CsSME_00035139 [Camellia sinensis var. sinensis]